MKHSLRFLVGLAATILLVGCASLPEKTPGMGLVILPLKFDNQSSQTQPIQKVDLELSNGKFLRFVPRNGYYSIVVTDPSLSVVNVRISLNLPNWSGTDAVFPVSIPLKGELGKLVILPTLFYYRQGTVPKENNQYWADWKFFPLGADDIEAVRTLVSRDPNYELWEE